MTAALRLARGAPAREGASRSLAVENGLPPEPIRSHGGGVGAQELQHESSQGSRISSREYSHSASTPVTGKRPRRSSAKTTAKVSKSTKSSATRTPASPTHKSETFRDLPSASSSDPDDDTASDDSEALSKPLIFAQPVAPPGPAVFHPIFGSSDSDAESVSEKKTPGTVVKADSAPGGSPTLPKGNFIPGYMQVKAFTAAEVAPCSVDLVNSLIIVTMTPSGLIDRLELPWGWFGPPNGKG
ncbi:unnamed protein product [Peronospora belbahrii]|uniref:Uncharacterized protein n=1 Tax=Peronospora belbahrii TaxID=622444 RepID=A0AAU9L891_9STRA|nr:unnamed protein product [Peronospora belbahrii]